MHRKEKELNSIGPQFLLNEFDEIADIHELGRFANFDLESEELLDREDDAYMIDAVPRRNFSGTGVRRDDKGLVVQDIPENWRQLLIDGCRFHSQIHFNFGAQSPDRENRASM